jgi:hypothetical protein
MKNFRSSGVSTRNDQGHEHYQRANQSKVLLAKCFSAVSGCHVLPLAASSSTPRAFRTRATRLRPRPQLEPPWRRFYSGLRILGHLISQSADSFLSLRYDTITTLRGHIRQSPTLSNCCIVWPLSAVRWPHSVCVSFPLLKRRQ